MRATPFVWAGLFSSLFALEVAAAGEDLAPPAKKTARSEEAALLAQSLQVVVVETPSWDSSQGMLQLYAREQTGQPFQPQGPSRPAWIGRAGAAWRSDRANEDRDALSGPRKREGDGRSPAGLFALGDLWGYAAQAPSGVRLSYRAITDRDRCVDDVASEQYNHLTQAQAAAGPEPWQSAERLRLGTEHYKFLVPIDYNRLLAPGSASAGERPRRGAGSCIFLHIAPPPLDGTAGCTALAEADLLHVLRFLDPAKRPLFLLLPRPAKADARRRWKLPNELLSSSPAPSSLPER